MSHDLVELIEALTPDERAALKTLADKLSRFSFYFYVRTPDGYVPSRDEPGFEFRETAELAARKRHGVVERHRWEAPRA